MGNYVSPVFIIPLFLSIFIVSRFLTVLFHELGHAIPAMYFTRQKVEIYLGSYGDNGSPNIHLCPLLKVYFYWNPFKWNKGMARFQSYQSTFYKDFTILILGPLSSLLFASLAVWIVFEFDLHGLIKLFSVIFFFSALFDLRNIYPSDEPIITFNGGKIYNDGYQIAQLIKYRQNKNILELAYKFHEEGDHQRASAFFEKLKSDAMTDDIISYLILSYIGNKELHKAKTLVDGHVRSTPIQGISASTLCNIGYVESLLGNHENAFDYYNKCLDLDKEHSYALCNRAYTYNLWQRYKDALKDYNAALAIDSSSAYAFANRGYTKIKLNLMEAAWEDIEQALALDDKEPYAYKSLGVYYLETGDYLKANENLQIAFKLNPDTHLLNSYIIIAQTKLQLDQTLPLL
jgi:tetratricopeptide (TPR) repeat protein